MTSDDRKSLLNIHQGIRFSAQIFSVLLIYVLWWERWNPLIDLYLHNERHYMEILSGIEMRLTNHNPNQCNGIFTWQWFSAMHARELTTLHILYDRRSHVIWNFSKVETISISHCRLSLPAKYSSIVVALWNWHGRAHDVARISHRSGSSAWTDSLLACTLCH